MARVLVIYAHPGAQYSHVNVKMREEAEPLEGITFVDLYAKYPRFNIDIDIEQQQLLEHDVIVLQFPMFWYSTPSLIKEWLDLTLEYGFAYGEGGTALAGKTLMLAVTAAGPKDAYAPTGYQNHKIRTFLSPLQQTAVLCKMRFPAPYTLFSALKAPASGDDKSHAEGYAHLLTALRDDSFDLDKAVGLDVIHHDTLPLTGGR